MPLSAARSGDPTRPNEIPPKNERTTGAPRVTDTVRVLAWLWSRAAVEDKAGWHRTQFEPERSLVRRKDGEIRLKTAHGNRLTGSGGTETIPNTRCQ